MSRAIRLAWGLGDLLCCGSLLAQPTFSEQPVTFPDFTTSISAKGVLGPVRVYCDVGPRDQWLIDTGAGTLAATPHPRFFALGSAAAGSDKLVFLGHNFTINQAQLAQFTLTDGGTTRIDYFPLNLDVLTQGGGISGDDQGNYLAFSRANGRVAMHRFDMDDGQVQYFDQPFNSGPVGAMWSQAGAKVIDGGTNNLFFISLDLSTTRNIALNFSPAGGVRDTDGNFLIGDRTSAIIHKLNPQHQEVAKITSRAPTFGLSILPTGDFIGVQSPRTVAVFAEDTYQETDYALSGNRSISDFKIVPAKTPAQVLFDQFDPNTQIGSVVRLLIDGLPADRASTADPILLEPIRRLPRTASDSPRHALCGLALLAAGLALALGPRAKKGSDR